MTKKYLMREIVETEIELTEEEVEKTLKGEHRGYKVELLDDVDLYMEQMNVKWRREDLEEFLEENGVPATETNLRRFMEINPHLNYNCEYGWAELDFRLNESHDEFCHVRTCKVKNPDFLIKVQKMYEDGELVTDDDEEQLYEILVDGEPYSNYISEEEMETTMNALLYKRDYEEVTI